MSFLVRFEIVGLYVNPLSTDASYCRFNALNLQQPIQIHLSEKPKAFCEYFNALFQST